MDVKLEAMNYMLVQAKGIRPVSSVTNGNPFAVNAKFLLEKFDREQQATGWYFNSEYAVLFTNDNSGEVVIPDAVLEARFNQNSRYKLSRKAAMQYTIRGRKVWDGVNRTYNIGHPVYMDIISYLPLEDCPAVYVSWMTRVATVALYRSGPVEQNKLVNLERDVEKAWAKLYESVLRNTASNALNTPMGAQMNGFLGAGYNPSGMLGNINAG